MIEKLKNTKSISWDDSPNASMQRHQIITNIESKINEIIDLLNSIVIDVDGTKCIDGSKKPTDQYAEQRQWIGKLCRFWNFKDGAVDIGILRAVDDLKPTIPYINDIDCSYAFCEPVKPDDDIIFKGE